ncbi:hypothetical protein ACIBG4_38000 [Nonomuraea sp. NPDC050383]
MGDQFAGAAATLRLTETHQSAIAAPPLSKPSAAAVFAYDGALHEPRAV